MIAQPAPVRRPHPPRQAPDRKAGAFTRLVATLALFTGLVGDFWRDSIGWWGWGILAAALVVTSIVLLVRRRRMPLPPVALVAFLLVVLASIAWSSYRSVTVLASVAQLSTTAVGVFLAVCLSWAELLRALATALRWIIGLSLVFELVVALIVRHRILPLWVDYGPGPHPAAFYWSRDLLLRDGRIQGIAGNSNILAMCALLAMIVFGAELADAAQRRVRSIGWIVLSALCFVLTRSSTVIIAAAIVAVAAAFALWCRTRPEEGRRRIYLGALAALVVAAGIAALTWGRLLELLGKTDTLTGRTVIWDSVIHLARQKPALGWGWTSYWAPWVKPFKDLAVQGGVEYLQAHEAWLDVWMQLGILGLVVFIVLAASTLWRVWFLAVDRPRRLAVRQAAPFRGAERLRYSALGLVPFLVFVAYLAQSLAESRLLIEAGWMLLVAFCVKSARGQVEPGPAWPSAAPPSPPRPGR